MSSPKVTVMMPVYNVARYLPEAIESVLRQDFPSFELIIYDDGSTDRTLAEARRYRGDRRVRIYHSPRNRGVSRTRNAILSLARGRYLAPHDGDDIMLSGRLSRQARFLDRHPEVGIVFGNALTVSETGKQLKWYYRPMEAPAGAKKELLRSQRVKSFPWFPHGAAMFRTGLARRAGGYNETLRTGEDTEFFGRLWGKAGFYFLNQLCYLYRTRFQSLTALNLPHALSRQRWFKKNRRVSYLSLRRWKINIESSGAGYHGALFKYLPHYFSSKRKQPQGGRAIYIQALTRGGNERGIDLEMDLGPLAELRRGGITRMIDYEHARIKVFFNDRAALPAKVIYHGYLLHPLSAVLRKFDAALIHAALVAKGDSGVLIVAGHGAGKSTLALSFLVNGYRYFSDEHPILVRRGETVHGESFVTRIGIPPESVGNFKIPKARYFWDAEMRKYYLDPVRIGGKVGGVCRIEKIIFPRFRMSGPLKISALAPAKCRRLLSADEYFYRNEQSRFEQGLARRHGRLLEKLSFQARSFVVEYSPETILTLPKTVGCL